MPVMLWHLNIKIRLSKNQHYKNLNRQRRFANITKEVSEGNKKTKVMLSNIIRA
jgi:hypothetical protein